MCLYGVVSVEDMAAASSQAVRLVSVGEKSCPATDFHRAASTCISSLPPCVGFSAPLSPRCRRDIPIKYWNNGNTKLLSAKGCNLADYK